VPTASHLAPIPGRSRRSPTVTRPIGRGPTGDPVPDRQSPSIAIIPDSRCPGRHHRTKVVIVDRQFGECDGDIGAGVLALLENIGDSSVNGFGNVRGNDQQIPGSNDSGGRGTPPGGRGIPSFQRRPGLAATRRRGNSPELSGASRGLNRRIEETCHGHVGVPRASPGKLPRGRPTARLPEYRTDARSRIRARQ